MCQDRHANLPVQFFIENISFNEFNSKTVYIIETIDKPYNGLTVSGEGLNKQPLGIDPRKATVNSAVATLPPGLPSVLDNLVAGGIETTVSVARFSLNIDPVGADHIGLQKA